MFTIETEEPTPTPPVDVPPIEGPACEVCGVGLDYSGRGRPPKRCAVHKKGARVSSADKPDKPRSSGKSVDTLIAQIAQVYTGLGIGVSFLPNGQMPGMIVANEAGRLAESWRSLIERDSRVRAMWEKMVTGSGWASVITAHALVASAIVKTQTTKLVESDVN